MTRTTIFVLLLTVLGPGPTPGRADSVNRTAATSTSLTTELSPIYHVHDLRHFMGFTLGKTTYADIERVWGDKGSMDGGITPMSPNGDCNHVLSYLSGPLYISFLTGVKKHCETVDVYVAGNNVHLGMDYPRARVSNNIVLPCGFFMGMKKADFISKMVELLKVSPEYKAETIPDDNPETTKLGYIFREKKDDCNELFVTAEFFGPLGDCRLDSFWVEDWNRCNVVSDTHALRSSNDVGYFMGFTLGKSTFSDVTKAWGQTGTYTEFRRGCTIQFFLDDLSAVFNSNDLIQKKIVDFSVFDPSKISYEASYRKNSPHKIIIKYFVFNKNLDEKKDSAELSKKIHKFVIPCGLSIGMNQDDLRKKLLLFANKSGLYECQEGHQYAGDILTFGFSRQVDGCVSHIAVTGFFEPSGEREFGGMSKVDFRYTCGDPIEEARMKFDESHPP